jgi:probable rRNA maturation factor
MKAKTPAIRFHYTDQTFPFKNRTKLKQFLIGLARKEGGKLSELNYVFCSDPYLLALNQEHLKHDTYTDIITFPYNAPGEPIVSDVFISIDRIRENAGKHTATFSAELHRVIFHGLLHLCGYKDKSKLERNEMRVREDYWLGQYLGSTWNKG